MVVGPLVVAPAGGADDMMLMVRIDYCEKMKENCDQP